MRSRYMWRSSLLLALFTIAFSAFITACSNNTSTTGTTSANSGNGVANQSPIKIGGVFSVSGTASSLGKPEMDTVKMLVEKTNAEGGINGRKIELIAYDDKSDQNEAVLSMKKLIEQDKVVVVIGSSTSGNSLAISPLAEKAQIPLISVASSKKITTPTKKYVFKMAQGDDINSHRIVDYLKKNNLVKIAWLNVDNAFGSSGKAEFEPIAKQAGIEIVVSDVFEATVNDAKPMLTRVKNANPQAIVIWGTNQESAVVTKNIRELGIEAPIIGQQGMASPKYIELAGKASEGVLITAARVLVYDQLPDDNKQKKVIEEYVKAFQNKYNYSTSSFGGHGWDAFHIVKKAIETAGDDPQKIRDAIESGTKDFIGISGIFNLSSEDHNGLDGDSLVMIEVKNGKFTLKE